MGERFQRKGPSRAVTPQDIAGFRIEAVTQMPESPFRAHHGIQKTACRLDPQRLERLAARLQHIHRMEDVATQLERTPHESEGAAARALGIEAQPAFAIPYAMKIPAGCRRRAEERKHPLRPLASRGIGRLDQRAHRDRAARPTALHDKWGIRLRERCAVKSFALDPVETIEFRLHEVGRFAQFFTKIPARFERTFVAGLEAVKSQLAHKSGNVFRTHRDDAQAGLDRLACGEIHAGFLGRNPIAETVAPQTMHGQRECDADRLIGQCRERDSAYSPIAVDLNFHQHAGFADRIVDADERGRKGISGQFEVIAGRRGKPGDIGNEDRALRRHPLRWKMRTVWLGRYQKTVAIVDGTRRDHITARGKREIHTLAQRNAVKVGCCLGTHVEN